MSAAPSMKPCACRYYGMSHVILRAAGELVHQHGNECAVIFNAYAPCRMEMLRHVPDETVCPIARRYQRELREAGGAA